MKTEGLLKLTKPFKMFTLGEKTALIFAMVCYFVGFFVVYKTIIYTGFYAVDKLTSFFKKDEDEEE